MLYSDRKDLLDLYNAVSGKHYEDPELLEINTLENAIYMSMHNDLSFLIDSRLSLYEHQSTYSPIHPDALAAANRAGIDRYLGRVRSRPR